MDTQQPAQPQTCKLLAAHSKGGVNMANRQYYDVIIIGGGPAGLAAGIYALRASMRTVLKPGLDWHTV